MPATNLNANLLPSKQAVSAGGGGGPAPPITVPEDGTMVSSQDANDWAGHTNYAPSIVFDSQDANDWTGYTNV